jgi:hypothetical protein
MRVTGFALLAVALLSVSSVEAKKGGVYAANDRDFKSAVLDSGKNAFVKFLAPW